MTEQGAKQRRPFHETIVDGIRSARNGIEMGLLAELIKTTKIPKGHDEIITAWNQRLSELGYDESYMVVAGVAADLLEQKKETKKEEEKRQHREEAEGYL